MAMDMVIYSNSPLVLSEQTSEYTIKKIEL